MWILMKKGDLSLINTKDVIRMKIPYPSIGSGLAVKSHMYICKTAYSPHHEFIKCQTLKPSMIGSNLIKHFCDELPDISRNPFQHATRIDCDKLFITNNVQYDAQLRTTTRPDVCEKLFSDVLSELAADGYIQNFLNEQQLQLLNPLITV